MFNGDLKRRIKALEAGALKERILRNCAEGVHEWEMMQNSTPSPYIRCRHCYKIAKEKEIVK